MDLLKQYITQAISSAANNLRLSTEKIEVVALLRQAVNHSADPEEDFKKMKRITELSKLAIKLNEIYNFLSKDPVDFQKLSHKFNEHSQYLIKDLNQMLESVSPFSFKALLDKVQEGRGKLIASGDQAATSNGERSDAGRSSGEGSDGVRSDVKEESKGGEGEEKSIHTPEVKDKDIQVTADIKEEESEGPENEDINAETEFKEQILKPIRPLDDFLKRMSAGSADLKQIDSYLNILRENGIASYDKGYATVADMHDTIYKALRLLKSGGLKPTKDVTESMRACLIVIATLIRNKAVDINSYLLSAEEFARKIETIKQEE